MLPHIDEQKFYQQLKRFSDVRVIGLLVFGVVVLLVTWSGLKVMQTNYELQKKEAELRQKTLIAKLENENLRLKNTYFESDEYLELTARRQFNKGAPGEKLYLVPEEVARAKTVELPETEVKVDQTKEVPKSRYQKNFEAWVEFLFNRDNPSQT